MSFKKPNWLRFELEDRGEVRFRDDDLFWKEGQELHKWGDFSNQEFIFWDEKFKEHKVKHIVACICSGIDSNPELVKYIRANRHIEVQIHGWKHKPYYDLSYEECYNDFRKCKEKIKQRFGIVPTIWYPTWNKSGVNSDKAAEDLNLEVRKTHFTLPEYLGMGELDYRYEREINFHYWSKDRKQIIKKDNCELEEIKHGNTYWLEACLYKYASRRRKGCYWDKKLNRVVICV